MHAYYILIKKLFPYNFQIEKDKQFFKEWSKISSFKLPTS